MEGVGAAAAFVHLARRQRRVRVDAIEVIAQVAIRVVLELRCQLSGLTLDLDGFMHVAAVPARLSPVV